MADCIFCKIVAGQIPAQKILENDGFVAFKDLSPQAKVHLLVIPKSHFKSLDELSAAQAGGLMAAAAEVARAQGLASTGYRTVLNTGKDAGQAVFHVHAHVLGGEPLGHFGRA